MAKGLCFTVVEGVFSSAVIGCGLEEQFLFSSVGKCETLSSFRDDVIITVACWFSSSLSAAPGTASTQLSLFALSIVLLG